MQVSLPRPAYRKGRIDTALAALNGVLQALDLTPRHDVGAATVQLLLGRQFIDGLLEGALGLLDLSFGCGDVGAGHDHRGVDLGDLAAGRLKCGLLPRAVELEDRLPLLDRVN